MEENKKLDTEKEPENETVNKSENDEAENVNEASEEAASGEKPEKEKKKKAKKEKKEKPKRIKNQALLRRGGYAVAVTAAVLAGLIVLNVLMGFLGNRVNLEFDMSPEKQHSISQENIDYLKSVDKEVEIIVCSAEDYYVQYMGYMAQGYGVQSDPSLYFQQTLDLLERYPVFNNKIKVRYIDPQTSEFTELSTQYSNEKLTYGDILVRTVGEEQERHKKIGFDDIYMITEDDTYASYGYTISDIGGNDLETAVTGAIDYVVSDETKKVAFITGHSSNDYTAAYRELLEDNNYEIEDIDDEIISSISNEYDALVLVAPDRDFQGSELDAISQFLENDGNLEKGLVFFADASTKYLTNLYDFLAQWGIAVDEGVLFETSGGYSMPGDPTTMISAPDTEDDLVSGLGYLLTGLNVPMSAAFESENGITVKALASTASSVVAAPVGTPADWEGYGDYTAQAYPTVLQSEMSQYNDDNELIASYVMAFSSTMFIDSQYSETDDFYNKDIALAAAERSVGADESGISFVSKSITNETFYPSDTSAAVIFAVFMLALPILTIVICVYIYIRRKNAV